MRYDTPLVSQPRVVCKRANVEYNRDETEWFITLNKNSRLGYFAEGVQ
jgi:hypothetical protein